MISVLIPTLERYGAQMAMITVARGLAKAGHHVEVVVGQVGGPFDLDIRGDLPLVVLKSRSVVGTAWQLRRHLVRRRPEILLAGQRKANFAALLARTLMPRPAPRVFLVEHSVLSRSRTASGVFRGGLVPLLVRLLYPRADGVVAVSQGVAGELEGYIGSSEDSHLNLRVIYNPVIGDDFEVAKEAPVKHPWFCPGSPPVVLSVGRLSPVKNLNLLLQAFALLRSNCPAKLIILGEGEEQAALERLAASLGIRNDVDFAGYVANPYPYMVRGSVLAVTSRWESFGSVIVEAMACGTTVVSTDCPVGPRELLEDGRLGVLVSENTPETFAAGLKRALMEPIDPCLLTQRGRFFSVERSVREYADFVLGGKAAEGRCWEE